MPPVIDKNKCVACGTCAEICNSHLFAFDKRRKTVPQVKYPDECWHCNSCVEDCPVGAVELRIPLAFMFLHVDADTLRHSGRDK